MKFETDTSSFTYENTTGNFQGLGLWQFNWTDSPVSAAATAYLLQVSGGTSPLVALCSPILAPSIESFAAFRDYWQLCSNILLSDTQNFAVTLKVSLSYGKFPPFFRLGKFSAETFTQGYIKAISLNDSGTINDEYVEYTFEVNRRDIVYLVPIQPNTSVTVEMTVRGLD